MKKTAPAKDIDEYIGLQPGPIQPILNKLRQVIKKAAPKAEEVISYQMPAFKQNGILVYFAAQNKHIGFYPTASGIEAFEKELANHETSKGTVRFPFDKPLPYKLIEQIVKFRVLKNMEKPSAQKSKK
jgi:uncharacterized protein YdhG (YjbR/CyaY superfamily)